LGTDCRFGAANRNLEHSGVPPEFSTDFFKVIRADDFTESAPLGDEPPPQPMVGIIGKDYIPTR
jgi:hypothetical protein